MLKSHSFMGCVQGVCLDFGYGLDLDDCIGYIPLTVHQHSLSILLSCIYPRLFINSSVFILLSYIWPRLFINSSPSALLQFYYHITSPSIYGLSLSH